MASIFSCMAATSSEHPQVGDVEGGSVGPTPAPAPTLSSTQKAASSLIRRVELVLVSAGFFLWERVRSSCWSAPMLEVRVGFVWCEWRVPAGLEVWSCIVWQGGAEVVGLAPVVSKCLPGRVW